MCDKLGEYDIPDPVTNDNVGVFSGEEFGDYFTQKYKQLVTRGLQNRLEALMVGAYIEELDMIDIKNCPKIIIESYENINSAGDCGKVYTDNRDLQRLYASLIEGSESHLRAFVDSIEKIIGVGQYKAQLLTQEEVDAILGR